LEGVLSRARADRIAIAHGLGSDFNGNMEMGTFNAYLYNKKEKIMYEISYFMNFSQSNIFFSERNRIYNFLFFQLLFIFINNNPPALTLAG